MKKARTYPAGIMRVIDGDTVEALVDTGFRSRYQDKFRLRGVDAVEGKHTPAAERLSQLLPAGLPCIIETTKPEKYGRWLADFILVDGRRVTEILLEEGLVVPYDGKTPHAG